MLTKFDQNYSILDKLGSGSFSTVFKIKRKEDEKLFAGKYYYKSKLEESKSREKFI